MNVKLRTMLTRSCLMIGLFGATEKVNGFAWYYSGNLLQNPDASSLSVNPPWTLSTGNWTIQTGPLTLGSYTINSSNGSPWFLNGGGLMITCSTCYNSRTVTLAQTVNLSSSYASLIQNSFSVHFVYGGDAFAVGQGISGSGLPVYYRGSDGYEANYRVDFLNNSGVVLATDTTGPVFNSSFGCVLGTFPKHNYGYRRTVTAVPQATRSIRFTATMMDRLTICYNYSTTSTYRNGFDSLWLELVFLKNSGREAANGQFEEGSAPGPSVKATLTPKPRMRHRSRG